MTPVFFHELLEVEYKNAPSSWVEVAKDIAKETPSLSNLTDIGPTMSEDTANLILQEARRQFKDWQQNTKATWEKIYGKSCKLGVDSKCNTPGSLWVLLVMAIQKKCGILVDGVYGPRTKDAVKKYQTENTEAGTVDGLAWYKTIHVMLCGAWIYTDQTNPPNKESNNTPGVKTITEEEFNNPSFNYTWHWILPSYDNTNLPFNGYYKWDFMNGKQHGKWIIYWKNNKKYYEWGFINGKLHGKWIYYLNSNNSKYYEWDFVNDLMEGKGTIFNEDGSKLYEWEFKDGRFNGKWIETRPDGSKYEWEFKDGWSGQWTYIKKTGSDYYAFYADWSSRIWKENSLQQVGWSKTFTIKQLNAYDRNTDTEPKAPIFKCDKDGKKIQ